MRIERMSVGGRASVCLELGALGTQAHRGQRTFRPKQQPQNGPMWAVTFSFGKVWLAVTALGRPVLAGVMLWVPQPIYRLENRAFPLCVPLFCFLAFRCLLFDLRSPPSFLSFCYFPTPYLRTWSQVSLKVPMFVY